MSEEYLDIVDGQNRPTGEKKTRSEVHRHGDWHRTVHVYFFRIAHGRTEILVHLRAKTKDLSPDTWDTRFGGHLKAGETLATALRHEMQGEVGIAVRPEHLLPGKIYQRNHFPNREFTYVYYYPHAAPARTLRFNDGEVQAARWMTVRQIVLSMRSNPTQWSANTAGFEEKIAVLEQLVAGSMPTAPAEFSPPLASTAALQP